MAKGLDGHSMPEPVKEGANSQGFPGMVGGPAPGPCQGTGRVSSGGASSELTASKAPVGPCAPAPGATVRPAWAWRLVLPLALSGPPQPLSGAPRSLSHPSGPA